MHRDKPDRIRDYQDKVHRLAVAKAVSGIPLPVPKVAESSQTARKSTR